MSTTASRDTTTGTTYEQEIANLLSQFTEIKFYSQVNIGKKRNGGEHIVDLLFGGEIQYIKHRKRPVSLHKGGTLVSLKYQGVNGSAEEKMNFEFMKLHHACVDYGYKSAIIVLAGNTGWKWKEYFLSEEYSSDMKQIYPAVSIISHEQFVEEFLCDE